MRLAAAGRARLSEERGDVPGWVFVTLLSAALVAALYAIVGDALIGMFQNAIAALTNSVG
ncbi:hypothetical protein JT358_14590 [Micrococcales bacterium 31B]|nr:hypothetical protein [Micrococcales bacterium 31B]